MFTQIHDFTNIFIYLNLTQPHEHSQFSKHDLDLWKIRKYKRAQDGYNP